MEKRVTTLEVRLDQTAKSIDRLDRSITDLRIDMEKKFIHVEEKMDTKFVYVGEKMNKKFMHVEEIIDRKFCWSISIQITSLLATIAFMAKIAKFY